MRDLHNLHVCRTDVCCVWSPGRPYDYEMTIHNSCAQMVQKISLKWCERDNKGPSEMMNRWNVMGQLWMKSRHYKLDSTCTKFGPKFADSSHLTGNEITKSSCYTHLITHFVHLDVPHAKLDRWISVFKCPMWALVAWEEEQLKCTGGWTRCIVRKFVGVRLFLWSKYVMKSMQRAKVERCKIWQFEVAEQT